MNETKRQWRESTNHLFPPGRRMVSDDGAAVWLPITETRDDRWIAAPPDGAPRGDYAIEEPDEDGIPRLARFASAQAAMERIDRDYPYPYEPPVEDDEEATTWDEDPIEE